MEKQKIAVVGLGYVGLPLAVLAQEKGFDVVGIDTDDGKVKAIQNKDVPFEDDELRGALQQYPITASTDPADAAGARAVIIAVPTPVTDTKLPDVSFVRAAVESVLPHLKPGALLVIESTINPGVMDTVVLPIVRRREDITIDDGADTQIHIVHCPERINPGDPKWSVRNIPRVVGGYSKKGTDAAVALYQKILEADILPMASVTEAEAVKILENTFRDINIAFINEMAKSFDKLGIDITNVIKGASTKPFAYMPHYPGNGVGGHCISVDPYYMIERAKQVGFDHQFLQLARDINNSMPAYTVWLLENALAGLSDPPARPTVALLGLAYKKNIDDTRESPALVVRELLDTKNMDVRVFDPYVLQRSTGSSLDDVLQGADAVMLACDHDRFVESLTPDMLKRYGVRVVIDGKNALDADGIVGAGIAYHGVGKAPY